jgi:hypothetical protein
VHAISQARRPNTREETPHHVDHAPAALPLSRRALATAAALEPSERCDVPAVRHILRTSNRSTRLVASARPNLPRRAGFAERAVSALVLPRRFHPEYFWTRTVTYGNISQNGRANDGNAPLTEEGGTHKARLGVALHAGERHAATQVRRSAATACTTMPGRVAPPGPDHLERFYR